MSTSDLPLQIDLLVNNIKQIDSNGAKRLQAVKDTLQTSRRGELAHVDLHTVLDPGGLEERATVYYQRRPGWLSWLEFARNVLVLAPITLTWIGLSQASDNYNQVITAHKELITTPFLLLWEQGFPQLGSPQFLTFSHVAALDFVLLVLILLMSVAIHFWRDIREEDAEKQAATLRSQAEMVIWEVERAFSTEVFRQDNTQAVLKVGTALNQFHVHAEDLLIQLAQERLRMDALTKARELDLNKLTAFASNLSGSTQALVRYGTNVSQVYAQLHGSVAKLEQVLDGVGQHQVRAIEALSSVSGETATVVASIRELNKSLDGTAKSLANTALQTASNSNTVVSAAQELKQMAGALLDGDATLRQAFLGVKDVTSSIQSVLSTTHDTMLKVADRTERVVDKASMVATKLDSVSAQLEGVSKMNTSIQQVITTIPGILARTVDRTEKIADRIDIVAERLGTLGVHLNAMGESNAAITEKLKMVAEAQERSNTASLRILQDMHATSSVLSGAINSLAQETSRLGTTISGFERQWSNFAAFIGQASWPTTPAPKARTSPLLWLGLGLLFTILAGAVGLFLFDLQLTVAR